MFDIQSIVNQAGITSGKVRGQWLEILCPSPAHNDKSLGNCGVNIHSGAISCFACNYTSHISKHIDPRQRIEIPKYVMNNVKEEKEYIPMKDYDFTTTYLDASSSLYLKKRGISQTFIDKFNIKKAISGWYNDYAIIPIIDEELGIYDIEARKLYEYEALKEYYQAYRTPFKQLQADFKLEAPEKYSSDIITYIYKKKVLYNTTSRVNETLFNRANLNKDKALYVVEGFGSIPKIYEGITENVTCLFGAKVADKQLEFLKEFTKIILIPDRDKAGFDMVNKLKNSLKNLFIVDIIEEDTHSNYVNVIKKAELLEPTDYLRRYFRKYL